MAQRWVSDNSISRNENREFAEFRDGPVFEEDDEGEFPGKRLEADEKSFKSCFDSRKPNRSTIAGLVASKIRCSAGSDPSGSIEDLH
jgi:hypothetical protein